MSKFDRKKKFFPTMIAAPVSEGSDASSDALQQALRDMETATESLMNPSSQPLSPVGLTVFISHSHLDREDARSIDQVIRNASAQTFFDQREIDAGDVLPDRLTAAIRQCHLFLLLWSQSAASSTWVHKEWKCAIASAKKIIPYLLDGTPLPDALDSLVYITREDQSRGHVDLLRALFGKNYAPTDHGQLFPGRWRIQVDAPEGLASAAYQVELFRDGSVTGSAHMLNTGQAGQMLQMLVASGGAQFAELFRRPLPCHGKWSYDDAVRQFTIDLSFTAFGQTSTAHIVVEGIEHGKDCLRGFDNGGIAYTLQRQQ